jgi:glycosyltransferase involved in cell wall biosynthesis
VILEAQASGLPVVAVGESGPTSLIESGESGLLTGPNPSAMAEAVLSVVEQPWLADKLRQGGLASVAERTWASALQRLADGYDKALVVGSRELVEIAA